MNDVENIYIKAIRDLGFSLFWNAEELFDEIKNSQSADITLHLEYGEIATISVNKYGMNFITFEREFKNKRVRDTEQKG